MTVLVLAGTTEARELCTALSEAGVSALASLAGATRLRAKYAVPMRIGGFGGAEGLAEWITSHDISALIDATHPFAAHMPWHAASAAQQTGLPRLRLMRPAWLVREEWTSVDDLRAAADALPAGATAFLSTGRGTIAPFAERPDIRFVLRSIEPPRDLPSHIQSIVARPPFSIEDEIDMLSRHGITQLISKNSGGMGETKLEAAARLDLPVIMVNRPAQPPGPSCATVAEAVAWTAQCVDNRRSPGKPNASD